MEKKKLIAASLGGVVLIGAGAYMYLQSNQGIDTPNTNKVIETDQVSSDDVLHLGEGSTAEEDKDTGVVEIEEEELTELELYEVFEEAYLESVYKLRNYMNLPEETELMQEYDRIEKVCPIGKTLPADYKEQYKVWRENYRVEDLSFVFADRTSTMYVNLSAYTYTNIYDDGKLECLPADAAVSVTGIGYDKASGWVRVETELGTAYMKSDDLRIAKTQSLEDQFIETDKVMYAKKDVTCYKTPKVSSTNQLGSISNGSEVRVIGVGYGESEGWLKVDLGGSKYIGGIKYVRAENFTEVKGSSSQDNSNSGNSGGQQDKGSSNSGSQQDKGNSGGQQGSNTESNGNSSNNSDSNSEGTYRDTGLTLEEISKLPDEQKIALGFTQLSNGAWIDAWGRKLPSPELSEEDMENVRGDYGGSLKSDG